MQRIRSTDKGLQLTDGLDIVTFSVVEDGVRISRKQSALDEDCGREGNVTVDGRANIQDLGDWLMKVYPTNDNQEDPDSTFYEHTKDEYTSVACVAVQPVQDTPGIIELTNGSLPGFDAMAQLFRAEARLRQRVDLNAFGYPLDICEGQIPILLARQTYDGLVINKGEYFMRTPIPLIRAANVGRWILRGLETIQKRRSAFGL